MLARSDKSPVILGRSADFAKAADNVIARKRLKGDAHRSRPTIFSCPKSRKRRSLPRCGARRCSPANEGAARRRTATADAAIDDARARGGEVITAEPRGDASADPHHSTRQRGHAGDAGRASGPILPLRNYARIEDAIATIHRRPPLLAIITYFGRNAAERRHVLEHTLSSAIAIDGRIPSATKADAGMTLNIDHGEAGFRRFSRTRYVRRQPLAGFARASARDGGDDLGARPALH